MRAKLAWVAAAMPLAAAVCLAPAARAQEPTIALTEIRQERADRSTRLVVDSTGPLAYTHYSPDPLTLVVDVPEVDAARLPARMEVGTREVESVKVTAMARADGRSLARIEVRLASLVPYQIYTKDKALHLVFERAPEAAPAKPPAVAADAAPAPQAADAAPAPAPPPVAADPQPPPATAAADRAASGARWEPLRTEKAADAPAPAPERAKPSGRPATRILSVTHDQEQGQLAVTIRGDGRLRYQDFFLGNPDRLVVDFTDVTSRAALRSVDINREPVKKIRLAQFSVASPKIARLVLDLSGRAAYRMVEASDGVKIVFGEGQPAAPAPLAALRTDAAAQAPPEPATVIVASAPPAALKPASFTTSDLPMPAMPGPAPAAMPDPQEGIQPRAPVAGEKVYTGHPISLDFKDGDLQDIFRLFADISGMNVVVNPGVSGKVTLKLNEVPWDQALDLILKANGLGYTVEGNVIRIARLSDLQKEESDRRKLEEEKQLAGELGTLTQRISYAKAGELSDVIKRAGALSARGSINVDTRTNTMIIKDLPRFLDRSRELIAELDRPTPQVEIEARIVVTNRNFSRDLGIQWGFTQQQTAAFGNTTSLAFPNSIVVNGNAIGPGGGIAPAPEGGVVANAGIGPANRGYLINLPAATINSGIGISLGNILGNFNLDVALTALESQGRGRLLSTPKVTTQNNQPAEIKQGVQIPIQTVANNTVTVQFKDAVLTLKVTPQITEAGTVILGLEVENNAADFSREVNGIPPINTQSAKTQVLVRDGATAVIGGIYQSSEQTQQDRTPFLSSLPIVGHLFRNRSIRSENNELLLFITPRIIKG
jgi:type IV pilus secretin PilQ/predicted competence protein